MTTFGEYGNEKIGHRVYEDEERWLISSSMRGHGERAIGHFRPICMVTGVNVTLSFGQDITPQCLNSDPMYYTGLYNVY